MGFQGIRQGVFAFFYRHLTWLYSPLSFNVEPIESQLTFSMIFWQRCGERLRFEGRWFVRSFLTRRGFRQVSDIDLALRSPNVSGRAHQQRGIAELTLAYALRQSSHVLGSSSLGVLELKRLNC
jgi:hypothetical protein